jgi:hypothetical protein
MTIRGILHISQMDLRRSKKPSLFNCLVIRDTLPFHDFQIIRNSWPESNHSFESLPKISSKSAWNWITIEILNETYLILFLVRICSFIRFLAHSSILVANFWLPNSQINFVSNNHNSTVEIGSMVGHQNKPHFQLNCKIS